MKLSSLLAPFLGATLALGIDLDVNSEASIKSAASTVAKKLRALYPTEESWFIPGEFGLIQTANGLNNEGYYWWEAGAAMGAWIDYWAFTGDTTYNDRVTEAMLFQVGPYQNYEPPNQTISLGNDDQAFWAIAALEATERGFPDPPEDQPQWLALGQAVFNRQARRWDNDTCGGGLRWQAVAQNKGYDYKNAISNGLFFHMGARLGRYTANSTYIDWAEKTWEWSRQIQIISDEYAIVDGVHIPECVPSVKIRWSYNVGVYLSGSAAMYDYYKTAGNAEKTAYWKTQVEALLKSMDGIFFNVFREGDMIYPTDVMTESACEARSLTTEPTCNTDQRSFKAYLSRFMGFTYQLCDFSRDYILPKLQASAKAAAKSCNGSPGGDTCGLAWGRETYDGSPYGIAKGGVGEHMSVMEVIQNLLVPGAKAPFTEGNGGTSKGDPNAGSATGLSEEALRQTDPSTTSDRAGAGILTTITLGSLMGLTYWLIRE